MNRQSARATVPQHVIIVGESIGLPNGMAPTSRIKYLALTLREAGATSEILLIRPSEMPVFPLNRESRGEVCGISFHYTSGTSIYSSNRFMRRLQEVLGLINGCCKIVKRICASKKPIILVYSRHLSSIIIISLFTRMYKVPLILELCEWPETQMASSRFARWRKKQFCRYALSFSDGALVISSFIEGKVRDHATHVRRPIPSFRVPILVDASEQFQRESLPFPTHSFFLFAGSHQYIQAIQFSIASFMEVSKVFPEASLVITGSGNEKLLSQHRQLAAQMGILDRVIFPGFLTRNQLLTAYSQSQALLLPLFEDDVSAARFPTKLAEYLLSARPVVTMAVGEVERYLVDGKNAYLAKDASVGEYARCMVGVLENPSKAGSIGQEGRRLCRAVFDYRCQSQRLQEWLQRYVDSKAISALFL